MNRKTTKRLVILKSNLLLVAFFVFSFTYAINLEIIKPKIVKANEALHIYDYFKARKLYFECLIKNATESNFGLAVIFSRKDNPFSNIDSALYRIKKSKDALAIIDVSKKSNLELRKKYTTSVDSLFTIVDYELFNTALAENTIASYVKYQKLYSTSAYLDVVLKHIKDSKIEIGRLLYSDALQQNKSFALIELSKKCDSNFCLLNNEIQSKLPALILDLQFSETASQRSVLAYTNFRNSHPNTKFEMAIDDSIFTLSTKPKTEKCYYDFIKQFPQNKNVPRAWQLIYNSASNDNSPNFFKHFLEKYPEYPYIENVAKEYKLSQTTFYKIKQNKLFGFCDENGNELIKPQYEYAYVFTEGYCAITQNGKAGYIGRNGNLTIPLMYDEAEKFCDGLAIVKKENKYSVITKKNEVVFTSNDEINDFSEGFAVAKSKEKYGYINATGNFIIEPQFENAYDFLNGFAVVEKSGKVGLIDKIGNTIIPFEYEWIDVFYRNIYRLQTEEKVKLFNSTTRTFVNEEYDFVDALSEGFAAVQKDDKLGYIDSLANSVIQIQFEINDEAKTFQQFLNGYAQVNSKGKSIIIDKRGKRILPTNYQSIHRPSSKLVAVKKKNKWGYVDTKNDIKIKFQYQEASDFINGLAVVKSKNKVNLIDTLGTIKRKLKQEKINFLGNGMMIIENQKHKNLCDMNFNIIATDIDEVKPFVDQLVIVEKAGKMAYLRISDKKFIWLEEGFSNN